MERSQSRQGNIVEGHGFKSREGAITNDAIG